MHCITCEPIVSAFTGTIHTCAFSAVQQMCEADVFARIWASAWLLLACWYFGIVCYD